MTSFLLPSLPNEDDLNARFAYLNQNLQFILANELGQYQLVKGNKVLSTIPSIRTAPPVLDTQFKMAPNSGIECIINRFVETQIEGALSGGQAVYQNFIIQLRQFDPRKSTELAVLKIVNSRKFLILESPRTTPYTELTTGIAYETAIVKISLGNWYYKQ
jgi:hypothetical protein